MLFAGALVGALAACSDSDNSSDGGSTTTDSAGPAMTGPSRSSVTVDGTPWAGNFASKCTTAGDTTSLAIYEQSGDARLGGGATISGDDTVVSVGLGDAASGLGYSLGAPDVAPATVVRTDNTFTVVGEAFGANPQDPTQPTKSTFEIVFACDSITSG